MQHNATKHSTLILTPRSHICVCVCVCLSVCKWIPLLSIAVFTDKMCCRHIKFHAPFHHTFCHMTIVSLCSLKDVDSFWMGMTTPHTKWVSRNRAGTYYSTTGAFVFALFSLAFNVPQVGLGKSGQKKIIIGKSRIWNQPCRITQQGF